MSRAWASKLTRWWDHTHNGVVHSLGHLRPFRFEIALPATDRYAARTVEIRVGFSCHTFTRKPAAGDAAARPYVIKESETRMFCPDRHALSLLLPDIVRSLPNRNCYFAKQQNYFVVELPKLPAGHEYRVFFDVRHIAEPDAVLTYVQSAYATKQGTGPHGIREKKVGFRVLVNHALRNTRAVPPP